MSLSPHDPRELRFSLGQFATGVTVVSFRRAGEVCAMTVNSFASVSLDPPLVSFCPSTDCRFATGMVENEAFTISVLNSAQTDVCLHFAGMGPLEDSPWSDPDAPAPRVKEALAWFQCRLYQSYEAGDHYIALGLVEEFGRDDSHSEPLLFFRGQYPKIC